jgi:hypothetical protein
MWTRQALLAFLVAAVALVGVHLGRSELAALSLTSDADPLTPFAATAEKAVDLLIHDTGAVYAGPCIHARSPQDAGKICATPIAERGPLSAYLIGRTFSEYTTWVFVERATLGWWVRSTIPLDFFAVQMEIPWPP